MNQLVLPANQMMCGDAVLFRGCGHATAFIKLGSHRTANPVGQAERRDDLFRNVGRRAGFRRNVGIGGRLAGAASIALLAVAWYFATAAAPPAHTPRIAAIWLVLCSFRVAFVVWHNVAR